MAKDKAKWAGVPWDRAVELLGSEELVRDMEANVTGNWRLRKSVPALHVLERYVALHPPTSERHLHRVPADERLAEVIELIKAYRRFSPRWEKLELALQIIGEPPEARKKQIRLPRIGRSRRSSNAALP